MTPWTAAYQASLVHRIFQAKVLEWGAIAFSLLRFYIYIYIKALRLKHMYALLWVIDEFVEVKFICQGI